MKNFRLFLAVALAFAAVACRPAPMPDGDGDNTPSPPPAAELEESPAQEEPLSRLRSLLLEMDGVLNAVVEVDGHGPTLVISLTVEASLSMQQGNAVLSLAQDLLPHFSTDSVIIVENLVPLPAQLTTGQHREMAKAIESIIRQYEDGSVDTTPQDATEQRYAPAPEGIRFPQDLLDEAGNPVSFVVYENSVMGGYSAQVLCVTEQGGRYHMDMAITAHPEQPDSFIVYAVGFSEAGDS